MSENFYTVKPVGKVNRDKTVSVCVPGSKSVTNRALLLAAVSEGTSTLKGCLTSDDAAHFLKCLETLGFTVKTKKENGFDITVTINGTGGDIPEKNASIYVGSAGTAARFLCALLAFSDGEYTVDSSQQMKSRPMDALISTLRAAGAVVECSENEGHFPLHIIGAGRGGDIPDSLKVDISKSSQFLSALLIAAGTLKKKTVINVIGSHGLSYVEITAKMMSDFGVSVIQSRDGENTSYILNGTDRYKASVTDIEPDMSAAAYFYAAAALLGGTVAVSRVRPDMMQGDTAFLDLLCKMGCKKAFTANKEIMLTGPENGALNGGFTADMSAFSDQALTLAAIAPFANAPITITGIGHIRLQECDRINAMARNLAALGIKAEEAEDGITIYPGTPKGCRIETFDDHRVAMSFALTGLRTDGVEISNPMCCKKTFAEYFDVLKAAADAFSSD